MTSAGAGVLSPVPGAMSAASRNGALTTVPGVPALTAFPAPALGAPPAAGGLVFLLHAPANTASASAMPTSHSCRIFTLPIPLPPMPLPPHYTPYFPPTFRRGQGGNTQWSTTPNPSKTPS